MRCELLVTTKDGQKLAGVVVFNAGVFNLEVTRGYEILMQAVMEDDYDLDGTKVSAVSTPEVWFKSLPKQYNGSYLRAKMLTQKHEFADVLGAEIE